MKLGLLAAGVLAVLAMVLLVLDEGDPSLSALVIVSLIALYNAWTRPLRVFVMMFFFAVLTMENPLERPFAGIWQTAFAPIGGVIFDTWNKLLPIDALRFAGIDVVLAVLAVGLATRGLVGDASNRRDRLPNAQPMQIGLLACFIAVAWLELYGLARGGDFKSSLWQVRELIWMPVVGFILCSTLRGPRDQMTVGVVLVAAAVYRVLAGAYFWVFICRPLDFRPPYVTSHADTVLFVSVMIICVAVYWEYKNLFSLALNVVMLPLICVGIYMNNRRLAYVDFFVALAAMLFIARRQVKVRVLRPVIFVAPFALMYIAVGWNSGSAIFKPVASISSMFSKDDRSSGTRDIEDYNLATTLKQSPLIGSGFGHEYIEVVKADDISTIFPLYRYIGHNSVLWLWSIGGFVGFSAFWFFLMAAVFLAARSYKLADSISDRVAALSVVGVVVVYELQAFGDMGVINWTSVWILMAAMAVVSKLATSTGAWPAVSTARRPVQIQKDVGVTPLESGA